jgi:glycosyltransferase involved in cell wall biosynthesis
LTVRCQLLGFFDDNPAAIPRHQVEEWNSRKIVDYLGHTDQVAAFIEQADCIVLPSYYGEGMPLSLLEGASMSKALIAARTSGCRDLIEEGVNGYLCRQKDAADLAEKMETYYHLPEAAKRQMGIEGRNKVLRYFNREIIAGIYLDKINKFQNNG